MNLRRLSLCGVAALMCGTAHSAVHGPTPADGPIVEQLANGAFDMGSIFVRWAPDIDPSLCELAASLANASVVATDGDVWQLASTDSHRAIDVLLNLGPAVVDTAETAAEFIRAELGLSGFQIVEMDENAVPHRLVQIPITLDGHLELMVLERRSVRAAGFKVLVDTGDGLLTEAPLPPIMTYVGSLDGVENSIVAASLHNGVTAHIRIDGDIPREFTVQPLSDIFRGAPEATHVLYAASEAVDQGRQCGGALLHAEMGPAIEAMEAPSGTRVRKECQIAFDADFEFYQKNGSSVANTTADIESVLNGVRTTYERDCDVTFSITTIIVRSNSSDPYTSTDPGTLLNEFRNHWQSSQGGIVRDIAHLMTGKNVDGGTIGIAWVGAVCTSNGYGLSESRYTTNSNHRLALTAHEVGHNFNAGHCDGNGDCHIMCSAINACNGVGSPPFFGNASKNTINTYAQGRGCLSTVGNTAPTLFVISPSNGETYSEGDAVQCIGAASDDQDDTTTLSAGITWTSNIQGLLGTGPGVTRNDLIIGNHTITASVTDSGGLTDTEVRTISVIGAVTIPSKPSGQVADETSSGSALLSWVDTSNNETSFSVQRQQRVGTAWTGTSTTHGIAANSTSYSNSPGEGVWRYRVRANNSAGSSPYTSFANAKPLAPIVGTATQSSGVVTFTWTDPSLFEENFNVQRQQRVGTTWTNTITLTLGANDTAYVESPGSGQWRYRVRSKVPGKNSAYTAWKNVTVP